MRRRSSAAIIGAAETTELGRIPHMSELSLHLDAARNAIADCGIDASDIDGVAGVNRYPTLVAQQLGLAPTYVDGTSVGGCSFLLHVRHAAAAIASGLASMVLITHGESGRSPRGCQWIPRRGQFSRAPIRGALRRQRPPDDVPDRRRPLHEGVRPHPRTARFGRRSPAAMGGDEPAGDDPRADHRRRRARLGPDRLPDAPSRVLSGHRWRWRAARHVRRARARIWIFRTRPSTSRARGRRWGRR